MPRRLAGTAGGGAAPAPRVAAPRASPRSRARRLRSGTVVAVPDRSARAGQRHAVHGAGGRARRYRPFHRPRRPRSGCPACSGLGPDRITLTSAVAPSRPWPRGEVEADPGTRRTLAALLSVLGRDWAAHGTPRPRGTAGWGARLAESGLGRLALGLRARRVDSFAALRACSGRATRSCASATGPPPRGPTSGTSGSTCSSA